MAGIAPMDEETLRELGWQSLLEHLAARCHTATGADRAAALAFLETPAEAEERMHAIAEVRMLLAAGEALPLGGISDVAAPVGRAGKGASLSAEELVPVGHTAHGLTRLRGHIAARAGSIPVLAELATGLADFAALARSLLDSFDAEGRLSDRASPELGGLRRRVVRLAAEVEQRGRELVDDPALAPYLQDRYVTQRDDRFVVPVRVEDRGRIRGIVHGTSQSGHTAFVEPEVMVELGNRLRLAECEVLEEERRILARLSAEVGSVSGALLQALEVATRIDLLDAAGRLAEDLDATAAAIGDALHLAQARHPLMVLAGRHCVPNDIALAASGVLVISGPNAGGKTVALKSAGLAALMVRAGLHVAAAAGSTVPWCHAVFSDIGDAQSLENDLSTFSGHVLRLRQFLGTADRHSLVLIDEICGGTDPEQGAALAQAVLEELAGRGVPTIVTTHYERLKALAPLDERFVNASVGFDLERMAPTFRLHLGVPGSSSALNVAGKLGLDGSVVARARALVGEGTVRVEDILADLMAERRRLEAERAELHAARLRAERAEAAAREAAEKARQQAQKAHQQAHSEAVAILRQARTEIDQARAAVRRRRADELVQADKQIDAAARAIAAHAPARPDLAGQPAELADLVPGTRVIVPRLGGRGEVVAAPERGRVAVQIGNLRAQAAVGEVLLDRPGSGRPRAAAGGERRSAGRNGNGGGTPSVHPSGGGAREAPLRTADATLDLRGERVDDALRAVDRYLDESLMAARPVIYVVHGHGTGALRSAVRAHLGAHPAVSNLRPGEDGEGGDGVTIAWLDV